jgi:predicted nucleotidyltransferase
MQRFQAKRNAPMPWLEQFEFVLRDLREKSIEFYGDRLISVVVFGSVGRGIMRPDSDIDVLFIVDPLPNGRLRRVEEFNKLEQKMGETLSRVRDHGVHTALSPVFKTAAETVHGSPLFLDMIDDARFLFDRDGFFSRELNRLRRRLAGLGAKRIWKGNAWYWDLKPDYNCGEEFEI